MNVQMEINLASSTVEEASQLSFHQPGFCMSRQQFSIAVGVLQFTELWRSSKTANDWYSGRVALATAYFSLEAQNFPPTQLFSVLCYRENS